jgi:hypothetical protein
VRFVDPGRLYQTLKPELDQVYFDVMSKGDLVDRGHLKDFEADLASTSAPGSRSA